MKHIYIFNLNTEPHFYKNNLYEFLNFVFLTMKLHIWYHNSHHDLAFLDDDSVVIILKQKVTPVPTYNINSSCSLPEQYATTVLKSLQFWNCRC